MKTRHHPRANRTGAFSLIASALGLLLAAAAALPQAAQAQSSAVAVLQSEMAHVKAAIIRIDKRLDRIDNRLDRMDARFERMDQTIAEIKETAARTDERINGLQAQSSLIVTVLIAVFLPLQLATPAALFALLTKGTYWGRERAPNPSAVARSPGASAGVSPGLGAAS
ncbi:MAG: hypothetical protein OXU94_00130 [Gammaproteobacteria bacterium]|nr:hypothetical protein [Gammaproteobacteria bacterium]